MSAMLAMHDATSYIPIVHIVEKRKKENEMRLIDADALIEKCGGWYVDECTESGFIGTLENLLATEPTIQPQSTTGQLNDGVRSTARSTNLIDRQAAIDALDFEIVHMTAYCDGKNEGNPLAQYNKGLEDGKKAIEALPTIQPEPQWIPVSERLPEDSGYYITSNEYNGVGEDFYYDGHFWNADKNAYKVIAWMPKPEHYKPNK